MAGFQGSVSFCSEFLFIQIIVEMLCQAAIDVSSSKFLQLITIADGYKSSEMINMDCGQKYIWSVFHSKGNNPLIYILKCYSSQFFTLRDDQRCSSVRLRVKLGSRNLCFLVNGTFVQKHFVRKVHCAKIEIEIHKNL